MQVVFPLENERIRGSRCDLGEEVAMGETKRFALIHMGTDAMYGMEFVASEILKCGHRIKWFDADLHDAVSHIAKYDPHYICFSPLTTFFEPALHLARQIKKEIPDVRSVFGGVHVMAVPEVIELDGIDIVVTGPVFSTVDRIVNSQEKEVIKGCMGTLDEIMPAQKEYFTSIPRIGKRHRKAIMSHFGCAYNCSYCATSLVKKLYPDSEYKKFWLSRRPIKNLIDEAKIFLEFPTTEVTLEDDDILYGADIEAWLANFSAAWKKEINLPIYGFVTPSTVVSASDKTLSVLADLVDSVALGVQAVRCESLKLFNRQAQGREKVKCAFNRLKFFKIPIKMEIIIGLPVSDPVGDALDSIRFVQEIGAGTFSTVFPLMLYPGTALYSWCKQNNIPFEENCSYDWYKGIGNIKFDPETAKKLRNLSKLGTFFIKYNINEQWIKSLINMELNDEASRAISESNYLESLIFRQGEKAREDFKETLALNKIRF